jgi:hypothetical protein
LGKIEARLAAHPMDSPSFPTNLLAVFDEADFGSPITNLVVLTPSGRFTDQSISNRLSLNLTKSTGLLGGSVTPADTKQRTQVRGGGVRKPGDGIWLFRLDQPVRTILAPIPIT